MKKILKWGGIIVIVLIVIGVIGSMGKSGSGSSSSSQSNTTNSNQDQAKVAKIGETVQDGDMAFTVTDVTTAASLGNQFTKKDAQGIFTIVTVKIENKGKTTQTIDSSMIQLTDSQGRKFDRSIDGQTAKGMAQGQVDLFLQQVQPGLNVTGDVIFDIPKDATGLKLLVKGSLFGSVQQIDLGK